MGLYVYHDRRDIAIRDDFQDRFNVCKQTGEISAVKSL